MVISGKIAECANGEPHRRQEFLILFITGFFIIFLGVIILTVAALLSDGSINFGTLIFIGPFPIVVGAGPEATWMVLFAIILAVLSIIMFLILHRKTNESETQASFQLAFSSLP
jgi:uncharacterized membrane protein